MKEIVAWRGVGGVCNKEEMREEEWGGRDVVFRCVDNLKLTVPSFTLEWRKVWRYGTRIDNGLLWTREVITQWNHTASP